MYTGPIEPECAGLLIDYRSWQGFMQINKVNGLLEGVRNVSSPNYDARPDDAIINALVIHAISMPPGDFGSADVEGLFCNRLDFTCHPFYQEIEGITVSAHLYIQRDGQIIQFVPFHKRAWHAGASNLAGRERVNDFSIGIELEGTDHAPFEEVQYRALVEVTRALQLAFPQITPERIVGHADIAPQRKTDPGPYFNWKRYRSALLVTSA